MGADLMPGALERVVHLFGVESGILEDSWIMARQAGQFEQVLLTVYPFCNETKIGCRNAQWLERQPDMGRQKLGKVGK